MTGEQENKRRVDNRGTEETGADGKMMMLRVRARVLQITFSSK